MRFTKRFRLLGGALVCAPAALAMALLVIGCSAPAGTSEVAQSTAAPAHDGLVARGEYLVTIGGCNDCHTPLVMGPAGPEPDMTRMLSGHPQDHQVGAPPMIPAEAGIWVWAPHNTAWFSQLGTAYASNLTPDENTGIGIWSEKIFVDTLRSGRHWGASRPILPPMPWINFAKMSDEDLEAVWAFLRTIPPVSNRVPDAVVAPPPAAATGM